MIACKDKPLLREEDDILNSHRSIFICKAEWRAVTGNHKVPDSWKQLKGFSVCTAWLITSMHTLACASGQPRFIPLLFNRALGFFFFFSLRLPANMLAGSVSLTVDCGRWTHLRFRVWISKNVCVKDTGFDWKCPETCLSIPGSVVQDYSQNFQCLHAGKRVSPAMTEESPDHPW